MTIQEYYSHPAVRERIIEYLGGDSLESATAVFVAHGSVGSTRRIFPRPTAELDGLLCQGVDIARSLWDHRSFLIHFDIEYVNFDSPSVPYDDHLRTYTLQQPAIDSLLATLRSFGIQPLHFLSGRGHHLIWRIEHGSEAFGQLVEIGALSPEVQQYYAHHAVLDTYRVDPVLGKAYSGLGMVIEFLTDLVIQHAGPRCQLPVTLSDVEVEPQQRGRETISVDVSEYSDPLNTRMMRIAFSIYTKALYLDGLEDPQQLQYFIPFTGSPIAEAIRIMRSPEETCRLAQHVSVAIPEFSEGSGRLIAAYRRSPLADFHDYYYSIPHQPPPDWPRTYDRLVFSDLPQCIRTILAHPSKILLRPAVIQLVVRALYARGWHPQHIAGLIRSKFERDYGWGKEWDFYNPVTRADFYIRAFSGALATGTDTLDDFTCKATRGKGYCIYACDENDMHLLREAARERSMVYE